MKVYICVFLLNREQIKIHRSVCAKLQISHEHSFQYPITFKRLTLHFAHSHKKYKRGLTLAVTGFQVPIPRIAMTMDMTSVLVNKTKESD